MGFDHLIAHRDDIVHRQLAGRVRIEHNRLIDIILLQRARRLDREELDVDVRAVQRSALLRQVADDGRLHAVAIDEARNLYARVAGQIGDQTAIQHVAADHDCPSPSLP